MFLYLDYPSFLSPEIIPGFFLRWYSLMYIVAFVLTYLLFKAQLKGRSLADDDTIAGFFTWTIFGLLLGARILSTLVYHTDDTFWRQPWLIFWPFNSQGQFTGLTGLSYHGGLLGALGGAILYCKRKKLNTLEWMDLTAIAAPLGYTFGRLGNFLNQELYGRATLAPWGMIFPAAPSYSVELPWVQDMVNQLNLTVVQGMVNLPRHPSQLYEAFLEGILLWAILWFLVRKHKPFHGFALGLYIIGYGIARIVVEYFREPDAHLGFIFAANPELLPGQNTVSLLNISMGQILSSLMVLAGVGLLVFFYFLDKHKKSLPVATQAKATRINRKQRKKLQG